MISRMNGVLTIKDLLPADREVVEGYTFFLSVAGKPADQAAPRRYLARAWYQGLITTEEGKRLAAETS